jgi:hypothetical protein
MLAKVLGSVSEGNIEEAPLAMATNDQQISLEFGGCLHNDTAWIANAEDGRYLQPYGFERRNILIDFLLHLAIGTAQLLLMQLGNHLLGKPTRRGFEMEIIDTQHMQVLRCALGQGSRNFSGRQSVVTVPIPALQRCC